MRKQNCWEVKKCGREQDGRKTAEFGVCSAAVERRLDGTHGGTAGGRACWVVAGTLCGGRIEGSFAKKIGTCEKCAFYKQVKAEEKLSVLSSRDLLEKVQ